MKAQGLLNSNLLAVIGRIGHGDMIVITDRGFPFPLHLLTTTIDLSVTKNIPRLVDVVEPVMEEMKVESVILPEEMKTKSPRIHNNLMDIIRKKDNRIEISYISHERFKNLVLHGAENEKPVVCMVKTGEFTPYANIILVSGIPF